MPDVFLKAGAVKPRNGTAAGILVSELNELNSAGPAVRRCREEYFSTVVAFCRLSKGDFRNGIVYDYLSKVSGKILIPCKISAIDANVIGTISKPGSVKTDSPVAFCIFRARKPLDRFTGKRVAELHGLNVANAAV